MRFLQERADFGGIASDLATLSTRFLGLLGGGLACAKEWYQAFFGVMIDLIIGFLGLMIKALDNQTEIWAWLSNPLIIKLFEMLDDNHDYFVYKTFTHKSKQTRLKPLSKPISQPPPSPPSSYQPPDTVDYLRFLYASSSWWRLLCHHKSATSFWLMPSMCFPGSCPWSFSWEHHAVFQLRRRLALSHLQMQGNHGTVSTS